MDPRRLLIAQQINLGPADDALTQGLLQFIQTLEGPDVGAKEKAKDSDPGGCGFAVRGMEGGCRTGGITGGGPDAGWGVAGAVTSTWGGAERVGSPSRILSRLRSGERHLMRMSIPERPCRSTSRDERAGQGFQGGRVSEQGDGRARPLCGKSKTVPTERAGTS